MTGRRQDVSWCWLLAATWLCLLCLCTAQYKGTTAAHWTLYPGLSLSWNEASKFCISLGGHLPVFNTKPKWNGFKATTINWNTVNTLQNDVWTGLFWLNSSGQPSYWEADCSVHQGYINFWGSGEPDFVNTDKCVRYKWSSQALHTKNCGDTLSIVCEFDNGSCHYSTNLGSLPTTLNLRAVVLNESTMDQCCWEQCMNYRPTPTGQECVAAEFISGTCKEYFGETLVSSVTKSSTSSVTTMLRECFHDHVNNSYSNYPYRNINSTPQPARGPCSANSSSFPPVPVPTSTCVQTSRATTTQSSRSEETTLQTTKEQSSAEPKTEIPWLTTELSTREKSETIATLTIISSDVTTYGSLSESTASIKSFQPLLCPCMKTYTANLPIIHRNTTSKYRRSHNSEWGSPSIYTSTSSTTFVIVVGVAGFLCVACDINRLTSPKNKKRRGTVENLSE